MRQHADTTPAVGSHDERIFANINDYSDFDPTYTPRRKDNRRWCVVLIRPDGSERETVISEIREYFRLRAEIFGPATGLKTRICNLETVVEFKKHRVGGLLRGNSLSL
jgi:hypothetical protein